MSSRIACTALMSGCWQWRVHPWPKVTFRFVRLPSLGPASACRPGFARSLRRPDRPGRGAPCSRNQSGKDRTIRTEPLSGGARTGRHLLWKDLPRRGRRYLRNSNPEAIRRRRNERSGKRSCAPTPLGVIPGTKAYSKNSRSFHSVMLRAVNRCPRSNSPTSMSSEYLTEPGSSGSEVRSLFTLSMIASGPSSVHRIIRPVRPAEPGDEGRVGDCGITGDTITSWL